MSFFGNGKEEVALLLDIGNGSITSSLVLFRQDALPEFLYCVQRPFTIPFKPEGARLVENMFVLLDSTLDATIKDGFKGKYWKNRRTGISKVLIAFSSPWFLSKTKHIQISKEKEFFITKSFLDDIAQKEKEMFIKELKEENSSVTNESSIVIEKSIVHTKINGYTLKKSIGRKTNKFDAFLCMSIVESRIVEKIKDIILKYTHVDLHNIYMHTFPLVSFTVIRDLKQIPDDFILMDITSEVTDLTLVQNNIISATSTMPSGKNFIVRQIAKTLGVSTEIAESTINLFIAQKLDEPMRLKVEAVLQDVEKEWSIYLENALLELSAEMNLPKSICITADSDIISLYSNFLNLAKTDATSAFRDGLNIIHINRENFVGLYKIDPIIKINDFILILAIFYNKTLRD